MPTLDDLRHTHLYPQQDYTSNADLGLFGEVPITAYSQDQADRLANAATMVYGAKSVPFYFTPAAPLAALVDMGEGVAIGDPLQAGLSSLGVAGKGISLLNKAIGPATFAAAMSPDEAEAIPTKWFSSALRMLEKAPSRSSGQQWLKFFEKNPDAFNEIGRGPGALEESVKEFLNRYSDSPVDKKMLEGHLKNQEFNGLNEVVYSDDPAFLNRFDELVFEAAHDPETGKVLNRGQMSAHHDQDTLSKFGETGLNYEDSILSFYPPSDGKRIGTREVLVRDPLAFTEPDSHYSRSVNRNSVIGSYGSSIDKMNDGTTNYVVHELQDVSRSNSRGKKWVDLTVRSILYDAAQEGADKVVFPTSLMMRDKWNQRLPKSVAKIYDSLPDIVKKEIGEPVSRVDEVAPGNIPFGEEEIVEFLDDEVGLSSSLLENLSEAGVADEEAREFIDQVYDSVLDMTPNQTLEEFDDHIRSFLNNRYSSITKENSEDILNIAKEAWREAREKVVGKSVSANVLKLTPELRAKIIEEGFPM